MGIEILIFLPFRVLGLQVYATLSDLYCLWIELRALCKLGKNSTN